MNTVTLPLLFVRCKEASQEGRDQCQGLSSVKDPSVCVSADGNWRRDADIEMRVFVMGMWESPIVSMQKPATQRSYAGLYTPSEKRNTRTFRYATALVG